MTHKSQECYENVFKFIEQNVMTMACLSYTTDYEISMRKALQKIHPEVKRFACYFHYCQAVKKHAYKEKQLLGLMRSDTNARSLYYRLLCLPLLPAEHIKEMFLSLREEAFKINKSVFRPFFKYFNKQWVEKVCIFVNIIIF